MMKEMNIYHNRLRFVRSMFNVTMKRLSSLWIGLLCSIKTGAALSASSGDVHLHEALGES